MQPSYRIRVVSLHMQETGTYNPLHERPMVTNVQDMQKIYDLADRLDHNQVKHITPAITAGIASSIVAPSTTPGAEIGLMNGWDTRRIRFILHIVIENGFSTSLSDDEYYLQGFTDYAGVSSTGTVDPRMLLIINNMVRVAKENVYSEQGIYQRRVVKDTAQIINGEIIQQYTGNNNYCLRPIDAFMGLQSMDIHQAQMDQVSFYDSRYQLNNKALFNDKYHVTPSAYLASVTHNYCSAWATPSMDSKGYDVFERAKNGVGIDTSFENLFFKRMKAVRGYGNGTAFSVSDLEMIDPNLTNVTVCATVGQANRATYHQQGDSEYWTSMLPETQWCTILGNSIPALMMELMISKTVFMMTNKVVQGPGHITIIDGTSITGADITAFFETFKQRLISEVMLDVSQNNQIAYDITVNADIFGEVVIDISLDNSPAVRYCIPTFLDSVTTPMLTTNSNIFYNSINDIGNILSAVTDAVGPDYGSVNPRFSPQF